MNEYAETEMARHDMAEQSPRTFVAEESEAEWERKRQAYASTAVDSVDEAAAVSEIVSFAELHGHAMAECFVGHWHFHGEGGLAKSDNAALRWYERAARHGDRMAAAARDKMYLDGRGCGPLHGVSADQTERAVYRLRSIATPKTAPSIPEHGQDSAGTNGGNDDAAAEDVSDKVRQAAFRRLVEWGYEEPTEVSAPTDDDPHMTPSSSDTLANDDGGEVLDAPVASEQRSPRAGSAELHHPLTAVAAKGDGKGGGGGGGSGSLRSSNASGASSSASIPVPAKHKALRDQVERDITSANPVLGLELQKERERKELAKELDEVKHEFGGQPSSATPLAPATTADRSSASSGRAAPPPRSSAPSSTSALSSSPAPSSAAAAAFPFGGGGYGMPPRRWTPFAARGAGQTQRTAGDDSGASGGGGELALRSAADVAAAAPAPGKPRGLTEASLEGALSLQCVLASRSYDEYMVMLETLKVHHLDPSQKPQPPPPLLPDDALTYGILQREKDAEEARLAALCDPSTVGHGTGFKIPPPMPHDDAASRFGAAATRRRTLRRTGGAGAAAGGGGCGGGSTQRTTLGSGGVGGGGGGGVTSREELERGFSAEPLGGLVALGGGGYAGGSVAEMGVLRGGRSANLIGLPQVLQGTAGGGFLVGTGPRNRGGSAARSHGQSPHGEGNRSGVMKPTESFMMYKMS